MLETAPADHEVTAQEIAVVERATTIANHVKNSDCFREFMASRQLTGTNGRTPDEVAAHLQSISGTVPFSFYFHCLAASQKCNSPTSAIAYRQPPDPAVFFNRAYFDVTGADFDIYELAGSLAHEALGHSLGGYDHAFDWTPDRDFSVPYSISGASRSNGDAFQYCRQILGYSG